MSVVVPLSTVGGVALSVLVSIVFFGDSPSLLVVVGTVVAVPALWLVSRAKRTTCTAPTAGGTVDGLLSGVGFALQNVALPNADAEAGLWPVAASRIASVLAILPLARLTGSPARLSRRLGLGAAGNGVIAAAAIAFYLLATRQELLTVAVVLSSLYPVIPVLLGLAVLRERLACRQVVGLACAGLAIALLSIG
jgi:drug/metabolite transporter (DMT)-like permease